MKRVLLAALIVFVAGSVALAGINRTRDVGRGDAATPPVVQLVTCDLPGDAGAGDGWDLTPPGGNWGGYSTSTFAVAWEGGTQDVPTLPGRMAKCTVQLPSGAVPTSIVLNFLAGLANDDFCIFATGPGDEFILLECVDEVNNIGEAWKVEGIPLPDGVFTAGQTMTIMVLATGNSWNGFNTYGQLAIDKFVVKGIMP